MVRMGEKSTLQDMKYDNWFLGNLIEKKEKKKKVRDPSTSINSFLCALTSQLCAICDTCLGNHVSKDT